jgi:hypothetical protein
MSGIKDLTILFHWMNNNNQSTLEASFTKCRKVPRERMLILNDLKVEEIPALRKSAKNAKETPASGTR